jgi:hypothetical protein
MATTAEHGMLRTEVDYAWPAIFRPAYEVKLVYLDLNQWIGLAKAATGHKDGARYLQALEAARAAKDAGTAMFPLSGTHYMELAGIGSFRHRSDIAGVMEELSDFSTILSRAVLTKCEVEAALTARFGSRPDLYSPLTLLNFGVGPAFGMVGGLRFRNRAGRDVTEEARLEHPDGPEEFDRMLREMNIKPERAMLRGPSPHEAEELRSAGGWDPTVARKIATERAGLEETQVENLNSSDDGRNWRRTRLRDVSSARHFLIDLNEPTANGLNARNIDFEDAFAPPSEDSDEPSEMRRFTDSMPSSDVFVTIVTEMHRNAERIWKPNDIFDIDALSVGVAYCDAVLCDNDKARMVNVRRVGDRLGTRVTSRLVELPDILAG